MAVRKVVLTPDPILKQKASKVTEVDAEVKQIIADLIDTLNAATNPEGSGIAAPQIGISKQICIARRFIEDPNIDGKTITKDYVLINPEMLDESETLDLGWEGCLSIPNLYGKVLRSRKIKISALNEDGQSVKIKATGFFARVIQHEIDHLQGILFTEKLVGQPVTEAEFDKILEQGKA